MPVTVRSLETLIRLATAHAKLRMGAHVEPSDLDKASKLLDMTIFNEPQDADEAEEDAADDADGKADAEMADGDAEEEGADGQVEPVSRRAARAQKRARREAGIDEVEEQVESAVSSKRMKVDASQDLSQLLSAAPAVDALQKKLVFKMVSNVKDQQGKCGLDALWKRFMGMPNRETTRMGTNEPLISSKEELIRIIEAMENDNLVMYAAEDNEVVLI